MWMKLYVVNWAVVGHHVVLCMIVTESFDLGAQYILSCFWHYRFRSQYKRIYMDLENFWTMLPFKTTYAVELSVLSGIVGCWWPNYWRSFMRIMPSFALMKSTTTLASHADGKTWRIMVEITCTDPLLIIVCLCFNFLCQEYVPRTYCVTLAWRDRTFFW